MLLNMQQRVELFVGADHLLPDFRGVSAEEDRGCVTCPSVLPKHRD